MAKTHLCGPGYASPLDAMKNGPREKLLYVCCIQTDPENKEKSDFLATIDVDPDSPTYCKIIHRLYTGNPGDEIHHSGWNSCSSCYRLPCGTCEHDVPVRNKLVLPCLHSDRVYIVDTGANPRAPKIEKIIGGEEVRALDCATLHTAHCLPTGEIMISSMGDAKGNGKCDFIVIDAKTLKLKGTWTKGKRAKFGYDFWYQPYWDIMVSSEWGVPRSFKKGFDPEDVMNPDVYGRSLNFYSWSKKDLLKSVDLGVDGIAPLEVRFLHNPKEPQGFVGCAVNSNVFRFFLKDGNWEVEKVIDIPAKKILRNGEEYMQGVTGDILISLDDKYLYLSNWMHGDIRQYNISDPAHPKLTGQVFVGGKLANNPEIKILEDLELSFRPQPTIIKGKRVYGGPQMIQLSLDGKRLYCTTSLYSPWDKQFYPDMVEHGSVMVRLNVDVENGGIKLDEDYLVDFSEGPDGPVLAHEIRYPGGDCTSDIWLAEE